MGWKSSDVDGFDFRPLFQDQTMIAKLITRLYGWKYSVCHASTMSCPRIHCVKMQCLVIVIGFSLLNSEQSHTVVLS